MKLFGSVLLCFGLLCGTAHAKLAGITIFDLISSSELIVVGQPSQVVRLPSSVSSTSADGGFRVGGSSEYCAFVEVKKSFRNPSNLKAVTVCTQPDSSEGRIIDNISSDWLLFLKSD